MKKKPSLFALFLCAVLYSAAQKTRINLYATYVFDDRFDYMYDSYTYYDGMIKGGLQWGAGIEYDLSEAQGVEILYLRQDTEAPTTYQGGIGYLMTQNTFKLAMNYIMLAGNRRFVSGDKVEAFGSPMVGMCILEASDPSDGANRSATKFAWGLRLGCNIALSEFVKLKLDAHMTSPVQSVGGGLFFGTGGAGAGLALYSTVYQFALGGGLVFVPHKKESAPAPITPGQ